MQFAWRRRSAVRLGWSFHNFLVWENVCNFGIKGSSLTHYSHARIYIHTYIHQTGAICVNRSLVTVLPLTLFYTTSNNLTDYYQSSLPLATYGSSDDAWLYPLRVFLFPLQSSLLIQTWMGRHCSIVFQRSVTAHGELSGIFYLLFLLSCLFFCFLLIHIEQEVTNMASIKGPDILWQSPSQT